MQCSGVRSFLSQLFDREPITPIAPAELEYLATNGYVLRTTKQDYDQGAADVSRLAQLNAQLETQRTALRAENAELAQDEQKEHSFLFHFEEKEEKAQLQQKIQEESSSVSRQESELTALESNINEFIQKKSLMDRMVPYGGEYLSLTGLGNLILNDLNIRNYRVADQEFPDFIAEIKTTYAMLRSIADKASYYVNLAKGNLPNLMVEEQQQQSSSGYYYGYAAQAPAERVPSLVWSVAIGLGKLQGDPNQIASRFLQAFQSVMNLDSTLSNKLLASEVMTAMSSLEIPSLQSTLKLLNQQLRNQAVPKELSAGVAATILAGRRYDGTYPMDHFAQFRQLTQSFEAAAILSVMNVPYNELSSKFQEFRSMFSSWGYMVSEDTEIGAAFLAIGELRAIEVQEKLKYIVEQLRNYLEYPLVAASILASIPVFEAHEVLDLMEKAVTLLSGYAAGLERSELVAMAVRMIHGVRNELVKEIDSTAKIEATPVQFTYCAHPNFFVWYYPVIIAHASYHSTFSGMGGFHPAHSHGVGGFAG